MLKVYLDCGTLDVDPWQSVNMQCFRLCRSAISLARPDKGQHGRTGKVAADVKIILAKLTSMEDQKVKFGERLSKVELGPSEQAKSQTENDEANQDAPRVEVDDNSNIYHSQPAAEQQQLSGRGNGAAYPQPPPPPVPWS